MSFLGAKAIVTRNFGESSGREAVVGGIILLIISVGALVAAIMAGLLDTSGESRGGDSNARLTQVT